jgi:hypothetical protein
MPIENDFFCFDFHVVPMHFHFDLELTFLQMLARDRIVTGGARKNLTTGGRFLG